MYFPKISVSILILSPTFFDWKLVILIVWGIKQTEALFFVTSTTVRLIPSIAIDPFLTTNFTNFFGTSNHTLISLDFFSILFFEILVAERHTPFNATLCPTLSPLAYFPKSTVI